MKSKILLIAMIFVSIQCSTKLITKKKVNGITMEKLNLRVVEDHMNAKYTKQNLMKSKESDNVETVVINEQNELSIINTYASRINGIYKSLSRHVISKDSEEVYQFYPSGYLRLREKFSFQRTVELKSNSQIGIAPIKLDKSEYFDENGQLLLRIDYSSIYQYSLVELLEFIEELPDNDYKSYGVSMMYLDNVFYQEDNEKIIREINKKGIKLEFNHPYWIITCTIGDSYENIYLDGATGTIIGRTTNKIAKRVN